MVDFAFLGIDHEEQVQVPVVVCEGALGRVGESGQESDQVHPPEAGREGQSQTDVDVDTEKLKAVRQTIEHPAEARLHIRHTGKLTIGAVECLPQHPEDNTQDIEAQIVVEEEMAAQDAK
ncbi:MAG: hypothetical protein WBW88_16370 [Rhodothermales bacterium]